MQIWTYKSTGEKRIFYMEKKKGAKITKANKKQLLCESAVTYHTFLALMDIFGYSNQRTSNISEMQLQKTPITFLQVELQT